MSLVGQKAEVVIEEHLLACAASNFKLLFRVPGLHDSGNGRGHSVDLAVMSGWDFSWSISI